MEAIKQIAKVKNGQITLDQLNRFESQEVEVLIFPVKNKRKALIKNKSIQKFKGIIHTGFTDTSENIDKLVYHE